MPAKKLTDKTIHNLKPPSSGRTELFDSIVTGLCIRCTDKGAKSWSLLYRVNGELRRDTLGPYPTVSLRDARQKARERLELVADGQDPRAIDAAVEAAALARRRSLQENNVAAVVEQYIKREASQRRWPNLERLLRGEISAVWGDRPIADIRKRDVISLVDAIVDRGAPVQANRVLTIIKMLF